MTKRKDNKIRSGLLHRYRSPILLVFGIVALALIGIATSVITNNNLAVGQASYNESGAYYGSTKAYARTADVVVCRGTSIADDLIKSFTCDVTCYSTDNDCAIEIYEGINQTITNGGTILFKKGSYPYSKYGATDYLSWDFTNNTNIYGYGAVLNVSFVSEAGTKTGLRFQSYVNNLNIFGLTVTSNGTCGGTCQGIQIENATNVVLRDVNVYGINGFQIVINARNKADNILLDNIYAVGTGTNDVIGGGTITNVAVVRNVKIRNSKIIQVAGSYSNAIDLVGTTETSIINNHVVGSVVFGSETKGTTFSTIQGNIITPINSSLNADIISSNETSANNTYSDNILEQGRINIIDSSSQIQNNKIYNPLVLNSFITSGSNLLISGNHIIGISRGITINGQRNLVSNNLIRNIGTMDYGIILSSTSSNNHIIGNLIDNQGTLTNSIFITNGANNISVIGNQVYGTYVAGSYGNGNSIYVDNYMNGGGVTNYLCSANTNPWSERTWHNSTNSCTCVSGTWKCWVMT